MATVEKRRSSRKSRRKHNDGGYSDTETDREVSSLTDRAFRSLCIGDEAVYNDSDLSASPYTQKDTSRHELKRTAHESFSLRVQQYEQDWMYKGTYGADIHKDQQWGVYGERGTQERLSSSFQQSLEEAAQHKQPPRELFINGTTEVSPQQRRSNSRVSSLIRAFNTEGQGDEAMYNDETSWDRSALMSIERELSEFSSYPQNMNAGYFPSNGIFSSQNTNYYSSEVAAFSRMNSASSFMRASHSMSTQVNPNFFIHSEFSPFKVWRDQNRFPFHRGQISGFMPHSEFHKWYETPMYKELSMQPQQYPSMFSQGYHTNAFAPAIPMNPQRSISASMMMQRASAVEKRCESELAGQYRKRAQSTGANRLPPQRPSTASPSSEMSRQVRDTISSVKSLQQKIKMMAEQNIATQSQQGFYNNAYLNSYHPMVPNMVNSNPYTAQYQIQKSPVSSVSPQPIEHAPVRAESRGATPDVKMSNYKSRAASLLYNLKDNRKRVKAMYSPGTFKGQDTQEKDKQEPKDFIIDVPEFYANEPMISTDNRSYRLDAPQYGYQARSPGMHTQNSQPRFENPIAMSNLNVPQYGYQAYSSGMLQNSQYAQSSQLEFVNPVENSANMLNVPQYGYQPHSPAMQHNSQYMPNSQYKLVNPIENSQNKLNVPQYGYQANSPGMQQNSQFPQFSQNTQNSQQLYQGQNSTEYYRTQMQGVGAPHHGFTGCTPEYYANTQLANGQTPYENTSSFTPYKQSMSDKGGGNYVKQIEQNAEVQRFGPVVQSRDYVSKDNSKQQFNEAVSGEYTGVDRYNQLKENKYDYNNVYSQDVWGQANSQQIQTPEIPSAQNYQNINAYPRTSTQENVINYNYEQKLMENDGARPPNASNQISEYAPPHPTNIGNVGYNTQQPGTYRDIYAPPTSHEFNKEIKMKENYAPQDNHKYYDQESKKQTTISSQEVMPIATEELRQSEGKVIKEIALKGTRHFEKSEQEKKITNQEQLKDISRRDQATNEPVILEQNKTNVQKAEMNETKEKSKFKPQRHKQNLEIDAFAKYKCMQDKGKDPPTAEELIKQLRGENTDSAVQEDADKQKCIMEDGPQRPEPEETQLIVERANKEELKEEPMKCEMAASSEETRIEQAKLEPSRKERVITEQASENQVGVKHVERLREEKQGKAKQAVTEPIKDSHVSTKSEEKKDIGIVTAKDKTPETEVQKSKEEKEVVTTAIKDADHPMSEETSKPTPQIFKEDGVNVNNEEGLSKSKCKQPVPCQPDKEEQAKTELAITKIKENIKEEQTDKKDEEDIEEVNDNGELPVTMPTVDLADRGADDFEHNQENNDGIQADVRNKTSTTDDVYEQSPKNKLVAKKVDTNKDIKTETNSKVISDTTEDKGKTYDDQTESQYVYSESSKEFKLSVGNETTHEEPKDRLKENVSTKDDSIEKVEESNASKQRDDVKQLLVNQCQMSLSNPPDGADKEPINIYDAGHLHDHPVDKVNKNGISFQNDVAKQAPIERRTKTTDQKTGINKETSIKVLMHKEKAQTKHEILTSKIKAHAEKEISAIKEGFAIKDALKYPTKPLGIGQNVSIRQKPPSQEVHKKQDQPLSGDTSKVLQSLATVTATSQPATLPQKHIENNEKARETVVTETNKELSNSKNVSLNHQDKKCGSQTDDEPVKPTSLEKDHLSKEDYVNKADLENTAPSLQFQNDPVQDISLIITGKMVTARDQNHLECKKEQKKDQGTNVTDSRESAHNNLTDSTTEKLPQQESSLANDRTQSETVLPEHLSEKVVLPTLTVPAKNKVLVETQPLSNKQAEESKQYRNKPPNTAIHTNGIKDTEEITGTKTKHKVQPKPEMKKVLSVSTSNESTQEVNLHIESIAIQVEPAVTEETNKAQQRASSNSSDTDKVINNNTSQKSSPSNDDVQKVLSSVRKQAQLLKNTNQQNPNNTCSEMTENKKGDETKTPSIEEGYFQIDKRDTKPQNSADVGDSSEHVSQETEHPRTLANNPSSTSIQDRDIKTQKQIDNESSKDVKPDARQSHHTRRHHMAKGRQRGLLTVNDSTASTVEVKPKPKVPIPEISALADYARLKVIVSKDDEDTVQKPPPNEKEGFFPLIQSRHSKCPVFTVDSQEDGVEEKGLENQSDSQVEVSIESVVFPITDEQHKRTGMFKLEVKEKNNTEVQNIQDSKPMLMKPQEKTNNGEKNPVDKIKVMLEKSRAKQAEEDKKAAQREEELRAREREAIAAKIRERRKKQREAERHAEEEGKGKVVEQQIHAEDKGQKGKTEESGLLQQKVTLAVNNDKQQKLSEGEQTIETKPDEHDRALQQQTAEALSAAHKKTTVQNDDKKSHVLDEPKEEQQRGAVLEQLHNKSAHSEEQKSSLDEQQRKAEEQKNKDTVEEQQRCAAQIEEQKKRLFLEEKQKRAVKEEQLKKAAQEEQSRIANEEQQRKAEEQKRAILEEKQQKRRLILEEQRRAVEKEQQGRIAEKEKQRQATIIEEQKKRADIDEHHRKMAEIAQEEQKQKVALEEQQRRTAEEEQRKMAKEQQRRQAAIIEEQNKRTALEEQQRKTHGDKQKQVAQEEQMQKAALEEQQRQASEEEQQKKMAEEKHQRQAAIIEEQNKRAALEEQQRKMAHENKIKQVAQEEQMQKAALEEQQRQVAQKEQQKKMAEEKQRRQAAIIEEQNKRAVIEEQQRKMAHENKLKQIAQEEQMQKAALEEHQRQVAQKQQQKKKAEEKQQRQAAIIEEQNKRAVLEEQLKKIAQEDKRKQAAQEEQQRQAAQKEQQRKMAEEKQQIQGLQEEQKQKAALEEQRKAAKKEQLRKMAEEEQERKTAILEEQKKIAAIEEQQRKASAEEQQRRAALIEEHKWKAVEQHRKNKLAEEEHQRKEALEEQRKTALIEETRRKVAHEEQLKMAIVIEEQKRRVAMQEQQQRGKVTLEEQKQNAAIEEQRKRSQIEETKRQASHKEQFKNTADEEQRQNANVTEKEQAAIEEQKRRTAHEVKLRNSNEIEEQKSRVALKEKQQRQAEVEEQKQKAAKEEQRRKVPPIEKERPIRQEEENQVAHIREERIRRQIEEEKEAKLEEKKSRQQQSSEENKMYKRKDTRLKDQDLPQDQMDIMTRARPAVNQEGTAQKEEQKNVSEKMEALQYYSLTSAEAEKPLLSQKRSNSNGPETVEDTCWPYTPVSPAPSLPRSSTASPAVGIKPSMFKVKDNTIRGSSLTKSIKPRFHKNFGEEFRVGSPMERIWDRNEGDQDALRCKTPSTPLPQYKPFSRRSLVLDEEDSRSIISNMSEDIESVATSATDLADIRALYDSDRPESACSYSSDLSRSFGKPPAVPPKSEKALRRAKRLATRRLKKELSKDVIEDSNEASMSEVANSDVVASPHFTSPISLARAPLVGSSVSSSNSEQCQRGLHSSPHATGPILIPNTSPPVSIPSSQNPGFVPTSAAPMSIPQVPSSPINRHTPKSVTQYQVESGFSQSYTQRRVMQDVGSGQYYVVDVPVEVKTKTFFDPETGKYVQLNVRESSRNSTKAQSLQGYPQLHLKPKLHTKPQLSPSSNAQYQGYSSYQSGATSSGPISQSMTPTTDTQDQQPIRSSRTHRHGGHETGFSYSPDKTPYMDTVNNVNHTVYNTQGSQGALSDSDSQLVNSSFGKRDIITMSELEDFMEVSDW